VEKMLINSEKSHHLFCKKVQTATSAQFKNVPQKEKYSFYVFGEKVGTAFP